MNGLTSLHRAIARGGFDLIVCEPNFRAPWHPSTLFRILFSRRALSGKASISRPFGLQMLRQRQLPPIAVVDLEDSPVDQPMRPLSARSVPAVFQARAAGRRVARFRQHHDAAAAHAAVPVEPRKSGPAGKVASRLAGHSTRDRSHAARPAARQDGGRLLCRRSARPAGARKRAGGAGEAAGARGRRGCARPPPGPPGILPSAAPAPAWCGRPKATAGIASGTTRRPPAVRCR